VTASDGKGDGTASLSFTVNIVENIAPPKPVFSKPNLFLDEIPVGHAVTDFLQGGQDSYTVTLDCRPANDVTVRIGNTNTDVLEVTPTVLNFNSSNWSMPQTVEVKTVGRIVTADSKLQAFTLPHIAITTDSDGNTLRNTADLPVNVLPASTSLLEDLLLRDLVEALGLDGVIDLAENRGDVIELILNRSEGKLKGNTLKKVLKNVGKFAGKVSGITSAITILERIPTLLSSEAHMNWLAETLYIHHGALQSGALFWEQAFSGQRFSFPLSLSQDTSPEETTATTPSFNALFSGNVDFFRFSDSDDDFDFDGTTTSYVLGLDVVPNLDAPLVTGLQLAFTRSHSAFEDSNFEDTEVEIRGAYGLNLFTVHPSVVWDATEKLTLWASLGYGRGETELTIDSIAHEGFDFVEGSSRTSSGDFFSVAAGANLQVWQSDTSALTIKVDGSTASFLDTSVQEGRLAAQLSRDFTLNTGRLKSAADLALLLSDSDPSAMEVSGSLDWLPDAGRLSGSTTARVLLFGEDRSEWGIGGSVLLRPGQQGEGLSLSLQPSFGQANASFAGLRGWTPGIATTTWQT